MQLCSAQKAKKEGRSNSQLQVGDLIRISGQVNSLINSGPLKL